MRHVLRSTTTLCTAAVCAATIAVAACDSTGSRPRSSPTEPTRTVVEALKGPVVRAVTFGQAITDSIEASNALCTISDTRTPCRHFLVIPPADGTLVVEIGWHDDLMTLLLKIEELEFVPVRRSVLIGRFTTTAGQSYRLTVGAKSHDFFEDFAGGQFTLATRMEK